MRAVASGSALLVYLEETDRCGRRPAYAEVVDRARKAGLAGATVLRGVEGFGASSRVHRQHRLALAEDVPVVVVVVDADERVDALVAEVTALLPTALVVRKPVEMIRVTRGKA